MFDTLIWWLRATSHLSQHHDKEFAAGIDGRLRLRFEVSIPDVYIISWIAKRYMETITYDLVFIGIA